MEGSERPAETIYIYICIYTMRTLTIQFHWGVGRVPRKRQLLVNPLPPARPFCGTFLCSSAACLFICSSASVCVCLLACLLPLSLFVRLRLFVCLTCWYVAPRSNLLTSTARIPFAPGAPHPEGLILKPPKRGLTHSLSASHEKQ